EGLDGLRGRLEEYRGLGARFAKWRAVITITEALPSMRCMEANAHALARYAALCQEAGIVPIVEPEVLMSGSHSIDRCESVTRDTHRVVFEQLANAGVQFDGMLLKPNMVISGDACDSQASVREVADRTVALLRDTVPAAVPGIVFLSGGQSETLATEHLQAMNEGNPSLPWALSFSYGRALQHSALRAWGGKSANVGVASKTLLHRARCNAHAARGEYSASME
ncbi:MAG: class I fructose-bisphosphate aldolase, partial [Nannocystaceae bacterium]